MKEQEARRKREREQENRKAIEAAGNSVQLTNSELKPKEDAELELRKNNDASTSGNPSNNEYSAVNGNLSPSESKEDQTISTHRLEDDETSRNSKNGRDHQHLHENLEKVHFAIFRGQKFNIYPGYDVGTRKP